MTVPFWNEAAITELHRGHAIGHKGVCSRPDGGLQPPAAVDTTGTILVRGARDGPVHQLPHRVGQHPHVGTDNSGKHLNYTWTGSMLFFLNANAITLADLRWRVPAIPPPQLRVRRERRGLGTRSCSRAWTGSSTTRGPHIEHPELDLLPSEYFARQIYSCFWFERASAATAIEQLGADHVMFETDFPHPTGITPGPASARRSP